MPELPEVEVVRRGLAAHVVGRTIDHADVLHPRAVRRHEAGAADFASLVRGRTIVAASRRGKYLWLPLAVPGTSPDTALVGHLGMSGQLLVEDPESADEAHLRVRIGFADPGPELRFVDQRTFGGLAVAELVDDGAGGRLPLPVAHIARDPLDPLLDDADAVRRIRSRSSEIKRVLLDQTVISGVATSMPTRPCGGPPCTVPDPPTGSQPPRCAPCSPPSARSCSRRSTRAAPASTPSTST
jgi:formamidopyrimidine-DNA glycosylase